ncbi:MAG: 50S ribosomal protein L23 [Patescibacteria group bacterium]|jgi:large subunit ribosomal protein L23
MSILEKLFQADEAPVAAPKIAKGSTAVKPVEKKTTKKAAAAKKVAAQNGVLVRPVVTEKAAHLAAMNQYVFAVSQRSNKITIALAVEAVYGIRPVAVHVIKVRGKERLRRNASGWTSDWKKAVVTLPKGKSITVIEGV